MVTVMTEEQIIPVIKGIAMSPVATSVSTITIFGFELSVEVGCSMALIEAVKSTASALDSYGDGGTGVEELWSLFYPVMLALSLFTTFLSDLLSLEFLLSLALSDGDGVASV
jgi:hypothetical protein